MKLTKPSGEKVTFKQFLKEWKSGMEKVTPLQQAKVTQWGQVVSAIGVLWGIIFSIRIGYWWMGVILVGGMIVLAVQMLGNWQKKQILIKMDEAMKGAEEISLLELDSLTEKEVEPNA